ncbi:MAG: hypothetical protein ACOYXM_07585 [Actinomycetota bacterium]
MTLDMNARLFAAARPDVRWRQRQEAIPEPSERQSQAGRADQGVRETAEAPPDPSAQMNGWLRRAAGWY